MKQTATEQRIRRAIEHAAPPMDDILSAAASRKEAVLSMEQARRTRTTPNMGRTARKNRRGYRGLSIAATALASAAAFMILFAGVTAFQGRNAVQSRITLDVNPSLSISVNKKERVLAVDPRNAEAKDVIGTMDFAGAQLEVTVNALVGSMLQKGYLDANSNAILVSVEDSDAQHAEALQSRISETINVAFGGNEAAVLTQTLTEAQQGTSEAAQYGISEGKAALIRSIVEQDNTLTFENLAPLGVQEIALIAESRNLHAAGVTQTGTTADGGYIGLDAAKAFALAHAGLNEADVAGLHAELDREDGTMVYDVEFYRDGVEYDYEIDAVTGDVRKNKTEGKKQSGTVQPQTPQTDIGEAKAKEIALGNAGVKESETSNLSIKLDRDDGRFEYDVKFFVGNVEYEYEIDAATGEIYQSEREEKKSASEEKASGSSAEKKSSSGSGSSDDIGAAKAKAIALDHAGVSESKARGLSAERDRENGVLVYEVEFEADGMEYEYEIDAATGKIRKSQKERDD